MWAGEHARVRGGDPAISEPHDRVEPEKIKFAHHEAFRFPGPFIIIRKIGQYHRPSKEASLESLSSPTMTMQKVYESEMEEMWRSLLDADMQTRYWRCCLQGKQVIDQWFKIIVALLSSGTVASWTIWSLYPVAWKSLSALAACVAIVHPLLNLNRDIEEITAVYAKWAKLALDHDLLFQSLKDSDRKEAMATYKLLGAAEVEVQERSVRLGANERLKRKCYSQVCAARGIPDPLKQKGS